MADDDPRRIDALLGEDLQLRQADRRLHAVGGDRHPRPQAGARGGAVHPLLERADPGLVGSDLADDAGPDAGIGDAVLELGDDRIGQLVNRTAVDQGLGRIVRAAIPPAAVNAIRLKRVSMPEIWPRSISR